MVPRACRWSKRRSGGEPCGSRGRAGSGYPGCPRGASFRSSPRSRFGRPLPCAIRRASGAPLAPTTAPHTGAATAGAASATPALRAPTAANVSSARARTFAPDEGVATTADANVTLVLPAKIAARGSSRPSAPTHALGRAFVTRAGASARRGFQATIVQSHSRTRAVPKTALDAAHAFLERASVLPPTLDLIAAFSSPSHHARMHAPDAVAATKAVVYAKPDIAEMHASSARRRARTIAPSVGAVKANVVSATTDGVARIARRARLCAPRIVLETASASTVSASAPRGSRARTAGPKRSLAPRSARVVASAKTVAAAATLDSPAQTAALPRAPKTACPAGSASTDVAIATLGTREPIAALRRCPAPTTAMDEAAAIWESVSASRAIQDTIVAHSPRARANATDAASAWPALASATQALRAGIAAR